MRRGRRRFGRGRRSRGRRRFRSARPMRARARRIGIRM